MTKEELEAASKYVSGGGLDKLPLERLQWFATVTRNMAAMAEAEIKRRGVLPFPR
ncbi:hypothetical protein [Sinorhizobium meliloti]|uniref:hypothetical protein n=1 Tax=Rhizobium meliloti TaxID=382 RepID=UPI0013E3FC61|nr:hypothetical protein [Sinorhizobium meliloti]